MVQFFGQPGRFKLDGRLVRLGLSKADAVLLGKGPFSGLCRGLARLVEIDRVSHRVWFSLAGRDHGFGPHNRVKFRISDITAADGFFAQGRAVLVCGLGDLGGIVIANLGG